MKEETGPKKRKYIVIVGARPNFIKAAPLFKRVSEYPEVEFLLVHTGQHFDHNMSKIFFDQMGIPRPDIQLEIPSGEVSERTGKLFSMLKSTIDENDCEGVITFGDIRSTLAGAIATANKTNKLIHIESGLRSHDERMPEEMNRVITDHLSDQLFVTEPSGVDNLKKEGIQEEKMFLVGNIMVESIELYKDVFNRSEILNELDVKSGDYIISTIHRIENTGNKEILAKLLNTLNDVAKKHTVIFPLHPSTKNYINKYKLEDSLINLKVIEPIGYIDFMKLVIESKGVVTDSGGIQEETTHLGVPCCTLRDNTERPVTLELGSNKLFPIENLASAEVLEHLSRKDFSPKSVPLWDEHVSKRILDQL